MNIYIFDKLLYIRYPNNCRNQRDQSDCKTTACLNDEECRLMSANPLMVCIKGNCLENSFICTTDRDCKYFRSVSKFRKYHILLSADFRLRCRSTVFSSVINRVFRVVDVRMENVILVNIQTLPAHIQKNVNLMKMEIGYISLVKSRNS